MEKRPKGDEVPTPTLPFPNTERISAPVELAMVKSFVKGEEAVEVETASCENGEVVPMPIAEVVADCVAAAWVKASYVLSLLLKVDQSVVDKQPKTDALPVSQVTAPLAYVRPVEKVVVATPIQVSFTRANVCPFEPVKSEEVAVKVYPPVAFPTKT